MSSPELVLSAFDALHPCFLIALLTSPLAAQDAYPSLPYLLTDVLRVLAGQVLTAEGPWGLLVDLDVRLRQTLVAR